MSEDEKQAKARLDALINEPLEQEPERVKRWREKNPSPASRVPPRAELEEHSAEPFQVQLRRAIELLEDITRSGPLRVAEIYQHAESQGISVGVVRHAIRIQGYQYEQRDGAWVIVNLYANPGEFEKEIENWLRTLQGPYGAELWHEAKTLATRD
jgi:uncharacterized protein (UPF0335 family)